MILATIFLFTAPNYGGAATKNDVDIKELDKKVALNGPQVWNLPAVLELKDYSLYKRIFELQNKGDWPAADILIKKLSNRLLMGHVKAQKYLHPTKYRSKYIELLQWMREYADHPQARRIYSLALRRRPPNWKKPPKPSGQRLWGNGTASEHAAEPWMDKIKKRSRRQRNKARAYRKHIKRLIQKGWPTGAYRKLSSVAVQKTLDPIEIAVVRAEKIMPRADNTVAVVVASGTILDGSQPSGNVGGDSTAAMIRRASDDQDVKALVLRVDSPGGSAFASDIMVDQRMLHALWMGRQPAAVNSANTPYELYTTCASLFGDR